MICSELRFLTLQELLAARKQEIKDSLANYKLQRRTNLRSKLLLADSNRKKFWKFLKSQIRSAGQITALTKKTGEMVFEQSEIEEVVLEHFEEIFKAVSYPTLLFCPTLHIWVYKDELEEKGE